MPYVQLQQAVFTSLCTAQSDGYQLAAKSAGVTEAQAQHLTSWAPSHDCLADSGPAARSINFHRIDDDTFCTSLTRRRGEEHSKRGGGRIVTHFFLCDDQTLRRFASHPFRILQAVAASGFLEESTDPSPELPSVKLLPAARPLDPLLLTRAMQVHGIDLLAGLAGLLLNEQPIVVRATSQLELLCEALLNLLPVEQRAASSFATGLKISSRRPFRLQWTHEKHPRNRNHLVDPQKLPPCDENPLHLRLCERNWSAIAEYVCSENRGVSVLLSGH